MCLKKLTKNSSSSSNAMNTTLGKERVICEIIERGATILFVDHDQEGLNMRVLAVIN